MYLKLLDIIAKPIQRGRMIFDGASYFDTGIYASGNFATEFCATFIGARGEFPAIGSQTAWNTANNRFAIGAASNGNIWFSNPSTYYNGAPTQLSLQGKKVVLYLSKSQRGINGQMYSLGNGNQGTFDSPILIGCYPEVITQPSHMYFHYLKCYRDSVKIAEFVPHADNAIIDLVSGNIIYNLGTGNAEVIYD